MHVWKGAFWFKILARYVTKYGPLILHSIYPIRWGILPGSTYIGSYPFLLIPGLVVYPCKLKHINWVTWKLKCQPFYLWFLGHGPTIYKRSNQVLKCVIKNTLLDTFSEMHSHVMCLYWRGKNNERKNKRKRGFPATNLFFQNIVHMDTFVNTRKVQMCPVSIWRKRTGNFNGKEETLLLLFTLVIVVIRRRREAVLIGSPLQPIFSVLKNICREFMSLFIV